MSSDLVKQVKALEKQCRDAHHKAHRAEQVLHAVREHNGIEDWYERMEVAEAAVERLEAVIDALSLPKRGKARPTARQRSET